MKTSNNKKILIEVKGLYKSFQSGNRVTRILKDINLDICEGEFVVIFGPSGCGKSTLLHTIMGLERPDSGTVKLGGIDMWQLNSEDRSNIRKHEIGIMYQNQNWIRSLNVEENIAFSAQLIGLEKEEALSKAQELLKLVGMSFRKKYSPSELSAGEQQKIAVGRSLITSPKVLIADEPTGNLDLKSGQEMIQLFLELKEQGKTIIMVTHNPEYLKYCDKAILMIDGNIRRENEVKASNYEKIEKAFSEDLKGYVTEESKEETIDEATPEPLSNIELSQKKDLLASLKYAIRFNLRFVMQILMYIALFFASFMGKYFVKFKNVQGNLRAKFVNISRKFDRNYSGRISSSINSMDLTEISFRNLWSKKSRSLITVLGMGVGIGFITFLLSLGYGMEKLVINEVTRIQDRRQIDILPTISSNLFLDSENIETIKKISGVNKVMPLINLAGRADFERSVTDVVVYGTVAEYLKDSSITLIEGSLFTDHKSGVVINEEFMSVIGMPAKKLIGEEISLSFPSNDAGEEEKSNVIVKSKVIGVVTDGNPSVIYIHLNELNDLKITEYTQLRAIISKEQQIQEAREQIEILGFQTVSVMDTISDVESLFYSAKVGLLVVGAIALSIAILGMFNTLTVSLLERTREVGLMKTIGMKQDEIRNLFINESILMSVSGGILGIVLGLVLGQIISISLSIISISNGGGYIAVSFMPIGIILAIILSSILLGFFTGLYPSGRAVKMAPLDALRYE